MYCLGLNYSNYKYFHKSLYRLFNFVINNIIVLGFKIAMLASIMLGLIGLVIKAKIGKLIYNALVIQKSSMFLSWYSSAECLYRGPSIEIRL